MQSNKPNDGDGKDEDEPSEAVLARLFGIKSDWLRLEAEIRSKVMILQSELIKERKEKLELLRERDAYKNNSNRGERVDREEGITEELWIKLQKQEEMLTSLNADHLTTIEVSNFSLAYLI